MKWPKKKYTNKTKSSGGDEKKNEQTAGKTSNKKKDGLSKLMKKLPWKKRHRKRELLGSNHSLTRKGSRNPIEKVVYPHPGNKNNDDDDSGEIHQGETYHDGSTSTYTNSTRTPDDHEDNNKVFLLGAARSSEGDNEEDDLFIPLPLSPRGTRKKTRFSTVVDSVTIDDADVHATPPNQLNLSERSTSSPLQSPTLRKRRSKRPTLVPSRKIGRLSQQLTRLSTISRNNSDGSTRSNSGRNKSISSILNDDHDIDNETPKHMANRLSRMRSIREANMGLTSLWSLTSNNSITSRPEDDDYGDDSRTRSGSGIGSSRGVIVEETIGDLFVSSIRKSNIPYASSIMNSISRISRSSVMTTLTKSFYSRGSTSSSGSIYSYYGGRNKSELMKYATQYRYSDGRPVVDETSHYVATTKWGIWLEKMFVPWAPSSTESLVTFLVFFSISQTIPMALTRFREGRWKMVYMQQALVNWILHKLFGMEAPFGGYIFGVHYPKEEENPNRPGIDWVFGLHLAAGVGWILSGSLQTILTPRISKKNHRKFGYVATGFFALHMIGCLWALYRDIVQHHTTSKVFLFQGFAQASLYFIGAILAVKNGDVETHRDLMVKSYLISIEGSGTIRFTAWMQYLVGNAFLTQKARLVFDTIQCQSQYVTATAANCVFPYAFRLQGMRLVTLYFNVLYLRTPEKAKDITNRQLLRAEIWEDLVFYIQTVIAIFIMIQLDSYMDIFDPVKDVTGRGYMLQMFGLTYYTYRIIGNRFNVVRQTLLMPRRNAVDKSALETMDAVRKWAELQGHMGDSIVRGSKGGRRGSPRARYSDNSVNY